MESIQVIRKQLKLMTKLNDDFVRLITNITSNVLKEKYSFTLANQNR